MVEQRRPQRLVTTITPQRISFAGGGTDLPDFYLRHGGGAVVSTTIDKYIYVTVKQHNELFAEKYRLNYSKTEHANSIDEIENAIARECLRLIEVPPPLFISTIADVPQSSGLGSSSAFAVGLLYALHTLRGEDVSAGQLAEEAAHVEINMLGRPIGKQDHYAAAFGGLNHISFDGADRVRLDPLVLYGDGLKELFDHSMMFWTGIHRDAGTVLAEQKRNIDERASEMKDMRQMAEDCRDALLKGFDPVAFGAMLDEGWQRKRRLASGITTDTIDHWYNQAKSAGALGGKLAGAGGGGFLFFVAPPERQPKIRASMQGLAEVRFNYEPRGARVLHTGPN